MALIETESVVLKTYDLAEADKIVVLLTQDHGIVRGVAKGAKRLKSKFGSGLEPFSIVHATYFQKDAVELVSIQKIDLVHSNFKAASNPDFLQKFAYLGELLVSLTPPHDPNPILYRMVKASVETAAADPANLMSTGVYFELWLIRLAGYLPDWSKCHGCGRVFDDTEETGLSANFHLMCLRCRRSASNWVLGCSCRSLVAEAMRLSPVEFAKQTAEKHDDLKRLSTVLKQMISVSIGRETIGETSLAISI
jgi:DNA repair protein RecO (recombination protein O)